MGAGPQWEPGLIPPRPAPRDRHVDRRARPQGRTLLLHLLPWPGPCPVLDTGNSCGLNIGGSARSRWQQRPSEGISIPSHPQEQNDANTTGMRPSPDPSSPQVPGFGCKLPCSDEGRENLQKGKQRSFSRWCFRAKLCGAVPASSRFYQKGGLFWSALKHARGILSPNTYSAPGRMDLFLSRTIQRWVISV